MATIVYGGIEFPADHTTTTNWAEEPQYSDDGMIYECTKFTIAIQSVLTIQALSSSMQALGIPINSSPGQIEAQLRSILNLPRQQFVMKDEFGNAVLITPAPGTVADHRGGPFPKASIKLFSPLCWIIEFEVETYWSTCSASGTSPDILSHRFSTSIRYDQNLNPTREVTGTLRVSKQNDLSPDLFRERVVPELPYGFIREGMHYEVEEGGSALKYTCTDRLVPGNTPPVLADGTQATDISGSYEEGTNDGVLFFSQLSIRLDGSYLVDKAKLFQQAAKIALAYVGTNGTIPDGALESCTFRTELGTNSNMAEINVRVNKALVSSISKDFGVDDSRLLVTPPGSTGYARNPGARGEWLVGIVHAKLVNPNQVCNSGNVTPASLQSGSDNSPGYDTTSSKPKVTSVTGVDTSQPSFSPSQVTPGQNYHEYQIDSYFVQNTMTFGLATGGNGTQIIKAADDVWYRLCKWTAERVGANPQLPNPQTSDSNETLVKAVLLGTAPQLNPDKRSYCVRASGYYIYLLSQAPSAYVTGHLPYDNSTVLGQLNTSDFQSGIISQ